MTWFFLSLFMFGCLWATYVAGENSGRDKGAASARAEAEKKLARAREALSGK